MAVRDLVKIITQYHHEPVRRRRLTTLFGPDGRILPYSFEIALGTHALAVMEAIDDTSMQGVGTQTVNTLQHLLLSCRKSSRNQHTAVESSASSRPASLRRTGSGRFSPVTAGAAGGGAGLGIEDRAVAARASGGAGRLERGISRRKSTGVDADGFPRVEKQYVVHTAIFKRTSAKGADQGVDQLVIVTTQVC